MVCRFSLAATSLLAATATAGAFSRPAISSNLAKRQNGTTGQTTFADIVPSTSIKWVDCYQSQDTNIQCTYLTVPLDYENEEAGTTAIAFARYFVSEEAEDLLMNPGGPGVSGVNLVVGQASDYAKRWNMNIVSFDPRGVNLSGPEVRCSYESGNHTTLTRRQDGVVGGLRAIWDSNLERNQACSAANVGSKAKYIGTSAVVQDMVYFVELQAALRGQDPKTSMVNFYGISYGTCVGQTLVNLYPDRIRRVLLDGNVYSVAHYQGWEPSGIDDFAHGIFMFSKLCFEAGPEWCALANGTNSIEEVHARFDAVIDKLNGNPIQLEGNVLDGNYFISKVGGWLYFPTQSTASGGGYQDIANVALAVEQDDVEALMSFLSGAAVQKRSEDPTDTSNDILGIITAVDIGGRFPWKTYDEWKAATLRLAATAPYNAIGYAEGLGLIGLAADAFVPPPSQLVSGFEYINTSAPVLFVNTPGDPVTPRSSAYNMQRLFAGSAVFIHNSPGHGYSNAPSKCTDDIIAAYFANASLPADGTWCEPDVEANFYFGGPNPTATETPQ